MGGKFRVITQVSLALLLALSLSVVTAVSVMAVEFPSISPTTAEYDLDDPAEVMTTITWGNASSNPLIEEITDDQGDLTPGLGNDYIVLVKHLIILNAYLEDKLTDIGDSVELVIHFDVGAAAFTITAVGTQPSISPTTAEYDLGDPADAETTITWGIAANVDSISENGNLLTLGVDYTVGATAAGEAPLTILDAYLASELTDIGNEVVLTIEFDVGTNATFTITAIGTQPSISTTTAEYDLDAPTNVETTITWGDATGVDAITENGNLLTPPGNYYTVGATVAGKAPLTILDAYLTGKLTDIGESVVLTIDFDVGANATFTITATGSQPSIDPKTAEYDLDDPDDVETTITWGDATGIDSITENGNLLTPPGNYYTVGATVAGKAPLTVLDAYLTDELTDIGESVVLTIDFNLGANATFTITAVGVQPKISPTTKEYDLDNPTDAATTITWNTATDITSIVDNDSYTLVKNTDYTVTSINADSATLNILNDPYIEGKHMDIGESVVLTIDFDFGTDATFTITATGIQPSIFPTTATYDILAWNDVTTTITWGSATSVVSIVDDDGLTLGDGDYTVTNINPGVSANLTILSSTYLKGKLQEFGQEVVLTISFDVGQDANLIISVPPICFIATAAYGTPMAEEIQILREFRDEYMLTNPLGQALVGTYYRVSPPIAQFIVAHPSLKPIVRAGLLPVVAMSVVAVNTTPAEKTTIVGSLVLALVVLAVWAIRRRRRELAQTGG
jgi:hypothetical protein